MDEATSALDAESEHKIWSAMENLMANRTTLVIAHRESTFRKAHQILILSNGQVVDSGTHEELLTRPDQYYRNLIQFNDDSSIVEPK